MSRPSMQRTTLAIAATAVGLMTVAACGSTSSTGSGSSGSGGSTSKLAPPAALAKAEKSVQGTSALTLTFKLDITPTALKALSGDDGSTPLTAAEATTVAGGTVVVAAATNGETFGALQASPSATNKSSFSLDVNGGGAPNLIQVESVGGNFYARASVSQLVTLAGQNPSELAQIDSPDLPAQFSFIKDAIAGKWLEIPYSQAESLSHLVTPATGASASASPSQITGLLTAVENAVGKDVTVTRGTADPTLGDHLILTGNVKTIASDLVSTLQTQGGSIPGLGEVLSKANVSTVPSKSVSVDVYVNNGTLSAVKLDLTQFMDATDKAALGSSPAELELDYSASASISAPSGATAINLTALLPELSGLLGKGSSGLT